MNLAQKTKDSVAAGLQVLQQQTCLNFVESSTETNRIRVSSMRYLKNLHPFNYLHLWP